LTRRLAAQGREIVEEMRAALIISGIPGQGPSAFATQPFRRR
jgi:hypothetical protein